MIARLIKFNPKSHILHQNQFNLLVGGLERYYLVTGDYLQKFVK